MAKLASNVGDEGALALRSRSTLARLSMMATIAVLLGTVGEWSLAAPWWLAYAAIQFALSRAARKREAWGPTPVYVISFINYAVTGYPTWYLWSERGDLGVAAASMFLTGMLLQLAISMLTARRLFWSSATPLIGYMIFVPLFAFGPERLTAGLTASACAILLVLYMAILRRAQQQVIEEVEWERQGAEAASRAKTEFLAAMSHEIRTPMNAVLGAAALLSRTPLTREQQEHVTMLKDGGAVLMQVLNDVLDLSKIEAGKLTIEPTDTDLNVFVQRCGALWRPRAQDAGLELVVEVADNVPPYVRMDAIRVGQVVFNLLSNALKFTPQGRIVLSVGAHALEDGRQELSFAVRDTGIGIAPDAMRRLFTAFEQADGSITRRFGGTGLGLAIGQKLAGMMGGELRVASVEGKGSTFSLVLPVTPCAAPEPEEQAAVEDLAATPEGLRILVAEDNLANQRIIELFLRPLEAEVVMVSNGQEAVDRLGAEAFDLVLMDMQMPVMDGLEATRRVRASGGPNAGAPILALTANVMDAHRQACIDAGMTGHVAKPIDARLLLSAVLASVQTAPDQDDHASATDCALGAGQSAA